MEGWQGLKMPSLRLSRGFPSSIVESMEVFLVNSEDALNEPGRLPLLRFLNVRRFVVVSLHNWRLCLFRGNRKIRVIPRVLSHKSVRFSGQALSALRSRTGGGKPKLSSAPQTRYSGNQQNRTTANPVVPSFQTHR